MPLFDREWWQGISSYEALIAAYDATRLFRVEIGRTLFDTPIYAYDTDGGPLDEGRQAVLVTAGAHAEEAAGVACALRLAEEPRFEGRLVILPCRDPHGWSGVRTTFRRAVGKEALPMHTHEEAVDAFRREGEIVWARDGFVVCIASQAAFCSFHPDHPANADTGEWVQRYLRETAELADKLKGLRLYLPGSRALAEHRDVYGWGGGPTVYVDESGRVGNFNRFFASERSPVEVEAARGLARRVRAEFAFDLHENFGDRFGMYTNAADPKRARAVYTAMIDAVREAGYEVMPLKKLLEYLDVPADWLVELYPGVYAPDRPRPIPRDAFGGFVSGLGITSFTTEMGLEQPLALRCTVTETAVRAGLAAIARLGAAPGAARG